MLLALSGQARGQAAQEEGYASYLSAPARDEMQLGAGVNASDMIGAEVVGPDGARVGVITDLLLNAAGEMEHVALDAGMALGMGSRHVAIEMDRLQPTEESPRLFQLEGDVAALADLPALRQTGERWVPER